MLLHISLVLVRLELHDSLAAMLWGGASEGELAGHVGLLVVFSPPFL